MANNPLGHYVSLLMGGDFDHFLVAVVAPQEIEAARKTLAEAGYGTRPEDLRHRTGSPTGQDEPSLNAYGEETTAIGKFLHRLMTHFTEEGQYAKQYRDELRRGHDILAVRVKNRDQAEHAASLLACHGGHRMRYYGDWTVRDMSALGVTCPLPA